MDDAHSKEVPDVIDYFSLNITQGLDKTQVINARAIHGKNELEPDEGTPLWKLILKQFDDLLVSTLTLLI